MISISLVIGGVGLYVNTKQLTPEEKLNLKFDANAVEGGLENADPSKIQEELNNKVADGMINISMNTSPVFDNGNANGNLLIVNSDVNNHPQFIEIVRDDTGETIYTSGVIPVGSKIESAKLDVNLGKGDYTCTAYFNAVDLENNVIVGKAGAKIIVKVKSN